MHKTFCIAFGPAAVPRARGADELHDQRHQRAGGVSGIGAAGEHEDTLYCDTSFGWYTNRQSVAVYYDPDSEPLPHVTLQSPDTLFVNDDDDGGACTNDFGNAEHGNWHFPIEFSEVLVHPNGWNNGTGSRFYALPALSADVISRLLMFGARGNDKIDIPLSSVYGISYTDFHMNSLTNSFAPVGWQDCSLNLGVYGTE